LPKKRHIAKKLFSQFKGGNREKSFSFVISHNPMLS